MSRGRRAVLAVSLLGLTLVVGWLLVPPPAVPPVDAWMAEAGLEPREVRVDGLRLRYVRKGHGPAVVLLHGLASSIYTWKDVLPRLARDHDVVALDLPGFGGSDQPAGLTWRALPPAVLGLLDALGIPRASLVGHSLGGAVAVLLAARDPERVERLVLVDAAGFEQHAADRPLLLRLAASPAAVLGRPLALRRLFVRAALREVFHDDRLVTDERVGVYLAPLARPGALRSLRSLLVSVAGHTPFPAVVAEVRSPTLIVWGADDTWIPVAEADRFVAAIPGARRLVIPACGHMPQEEHPAVVADALEKFL